MDGLCCWLLVHPASTNSSVHTRPEALTGLSIEIIEYFLRTMLLHASQPVPT